MIELVNRQARDTIMGTPDYERVRSAIRQRIASGMWQPGDRLPKIKELAELFDSKPTTVKTALAFLREDGLVRGQQGKGIYVADHLPPDLTARA